MILRYNSYRASHKKVYFFQKQNFSGLVDVNFFVNNSCEPLPEMEENMNGFSFLPFLGSNDNFYVTFHSSDFNTFVSKTIYK